MKDAKYIKPEVEDCLYVMNSTLNQMVNYIPYKIFGFGEILNITTYEEKNRKWDAYFKETVANEIQPCDIKFRQADILKIGKLKDGLQKKLSEDPPLKIFWNITGGQRPVILAIYDLVNKNYEEQEDLKFLNEISHYLCYLEGNSGGMKIMKFINGKEDDAFPNSYRYGLDLIDLDVKRALNLMGYRANATPLNLLEPSAEKLKKALLCFYGLFFEEYKKSKNIQLNMVELNSEKSGVQNFDLIIDALPITDDLKQKCRIQWQEHQNKKAFGYILEEMLLYLLVCIIERTPDLRENISGVYSSLKIANPEIPNSRTTDEFDTMILTKTGQLIVFECKSGSMDGDVAKSTKYSTYAIGGVYGAPILVTPQISDIDTINGNITNSIKAAERANLTVWYLNEKDIKESLLTLIN